MIHAGIKVASIAERIHKRPRIMLLTPYHALVDLPVHGEGGARLGDVHQYRKVNQPTALVVPLTV